MGGMGSWIRVLKELIVIKLAELVKNNNNYNNSPKCLAGRTLIGQISGYYSGDFEEDTYIKSFHYFERKKLGTS